MFGSVGENKELKLGELARNIGLSFLYQNVRFLVVQVNSVADQPTEVIKPPFITQLPSTRYFTLDFVSQKCYKDQCIH